MVKADDKGGVHRVLCCFQFWNGTLFPESVLSDEDSANPQREPILRCTSYVPSFEIPQIVMSTAASSISSESSQLIRVLQQEPLARSGKKRSRLACSCRALAASWSN